MGSINGGTTITIFGEYFNPNATDIEVLVGGEVNIYACTVIAFEGEFFALSYYSGE